MGGFLSNSTYFKVQTNKEITSALIQQILQVNTDRIQVDCSRFSITAKGWKCLNDEVFKVNPKIGLRLYSGLELDLSFLQHLPDVEKLSVENSLVKNEHCLSSLSSLKSLTYFVCEQDNLNIFEKLALPLEELFIGTDNSKKKSIDVLPVATFKQLK